MRVSVCQFDNRAGHIDDSLTALKAHVGEHHSELLLLPEMALSDWLAADAEVDEGRWRKAVEAHESRITSFGDFTVGAIIGTRPIIDAGGEFRNQAYLWTRQAPLQAVHDKYYLPNEKGYWEANWYRRGELQFEVCHALGVRIGVQICTEMWYFEWARYFAREGVELLCIPRATPHDSWSKWLAGGRAAAVCAGAYCLSSNLWNPPGSHADCGGPGWVISPEGDVLAQTDPDRRCVSVDIDVEFARVSKQTYPRYVAE